MSRRPMTEIMKSRNGTKDLAQSAPARKIFHLMAYLQDELNARLAKVYISRYRAMESAANRLQKEAKGYLDALRGRWPLCKMTGPEKLNLIVSHDRLSNAHCRNHRRFLRRRRCKRRSKQELQTSSRRSRRRNHQSTRWALPVKPRPS